MGWRRFRRRSLRFVFFYLPGTITDLGLATDSNICPGHHPGPQIVEPHQGTSYNPPVENLAEAKKIEEAHAVEPHKEGLAAGMKLAEKVLVEDDKAEEREEGMVKSVPDRKTVAEE